LAFVTKNVFHQLITYIVPQREEEITKPFFIENIYGRGELYHFFYQHELQRLYAYKQILENQNNLSYYTFNEKKKDNFRFVFYKGGYLKYHTNFQCESLSKDFLDFNVPPEVQKRGEDLVNTYRGWFKTMKFREKFENEEIINHQIVNAYNNVFSVTHNIEPKLNIGYKLIQEVKKSGTVYLEGAFDKKGFEKELDEIIEYRFSICNSDTSKFLAKADYMRNWKNKDIVEKINLLSENYPSAIHSDIIKNYGVENLKIFWSLHYKLKSRVNFLLGKYFRWSYQFHKMDFDRLTLEDFGLRCCSFCESRQPF